MAALDFIRGLFGLRAPTVAPPLALPSGRHDIFDRSTFDASRHNLIRNDKDPALYVSALAAAEQGYTQLLYSFCTSARAKDSRLAQVTRMRNMSVAARDFTIEPYSNSAEDREVAAMCDTLFRDVPNVRSLLSELNDANNTSLTVAQHQWSMRPDGLKTSHPYLVPNTLFRWSNADLIIDQGKHRGRTVDEVNASPETRWSLIVHSPTNGFPFTPYARGSLIPLIPISISKRHGFSWWMSALERFGQPQIVGKVPSEGGKALRDQVRDLIEDLNAQWAGAIDSNISIEAIAGAKLDSDLHLRFMDWCNKEIAIGALGQNLTTEIMQGSHAAAVVARAVQADIALNDIQSLETTIRDYWLAALVEKNRPGAAVPFFRVALSTPSEFTIDEFAQKICTLDEYRTAKGYGSIVVSGETDAPETARTPLNGAQAASAQSIVEAVASKRIPRESGIALLAQMLQVPSEQAEAIVGSAGLSFVPSVQVN